MIWQVIFTGVAVLYAYWLYQLIIGLRGFGYEPPALLAKTLRRFTIVIPAHDEAVVVGHLIDSLIGQEYPRDRFDVYVIADACADDTEQVAVDRGVSVLAWSGEPLGKSRNLSWAFDQIDLERYDAVAVFDADNIALPDWLARMNDYLEAHPSAEVVQGYLDSKNPDDSWVTRVYALQYWYLNRFWSLARSRWGLSVNVGGTGFVIRTSKLRELGWEMESLTEDLELTCKLVLRGDRVWWNESAVSYDEKPVTGGASRQQRTRWLQGHFWLARRYGSACLIRLFRTRRAQYLDLFLHLLVPGRSAMSWMPMFTGLVVGAVFVAFERTVGPPPIVWRVFPSFAICQIAVQLLVAPSMRRRRFTARYLGDLPSFFLYGLAWLPMVLRALLRSGDQRHWIKTTHERAIPVSEVRSSSERRG